MKTINIKNKLFCDIVKDLNDNASFDIADIRIIKDKDENEDKIIIVVSPRANWFTYSDFELLKENYGEKIHFKVFATTYNEKLTIGVSIEEFKDENEDENEERLICSGDNENEFLFLSPNDEKEILKEE